MRYLFGFLCVCALGLMPLVGCSETAGDGGSGGSGGDGGAGGMPQCESALDCYDKNECTTDVCDFASGSCQNTAIADGTECGGETYWGNPRGGCYGGLCNYVPVTVEIGPKEVVFDWSTDRCEDLDLPDQPARFIRAADGELVLFDGNAPTYYVSRGVGFDSLKRVCHPPALVSADLRTAESYENWEWLWTIYREGATWHGLIHNEFHDAVAPTCKPGDPAPGNPCWYNSITYAMSTDGARTFVKPSPPEHVVAPAPRVWIPPNTQLEEWYVDGYFNPSNIVRGPDDYYYTLFSLKRIDPATAIDLRGTCAMRTKTLNDPASWRAWDGTGFDLPLTSPYVAGGEVPECASVGVPLGLNVPILTYNTYLERYITVDEHLSWEDGEWVCGFVLSTSVDLIHWSEVQLITPARIGCDTDDTTPGQLEPVPVGGPSLVDHSDSTTNFERPGRTPYLYYTRQNRGLDRDLVRVPLTFTLAE